MVRNILPPSIPSKHATGGLASFELTYFVMSWQPCQPPCHYPEFCLLNNNNNRYNACWLHNLTEAVALRHSKVESCYHDNDLILTPIISPQSGWQ